MRVIANTKYDNKTDRYLNKKLSNMIERCHNPNNNGYSTYGGRGVSVCDEWRYDSAAWRKWSYENGFEMGLTIERNDPNGNYCPENCCWIAKSEQAKNRRTSIVVNYNGKPTLLTKLLETTDLDHSTVRARLKRGWSAHDALYRPLDFSSRFQKGVSHPYYPRHRV